jgi:hypothetical protein
MEWFPTCWYVFVSSPLLSIKSSGYKYVICNLKFEPMQLLPEPVIIPTYYILSTSNWDKYKSHIYHMHEQLTLELNNLFILNFVIMSTSTICPQTWIGEVIDTRMVEENEWFLTNFLGHTEYLIWKFTHRCHGKGKWEGDLHACPVALHINGCIIILGRNIVNHLRSTRSLNFSAVRHIKLLFLITCRSLQFTWSWIQDSCKWYAEQSSHYLLPPKPAVWLKYGRW